jgi:tRNA-dihydrouridine synthase
MFKKIILKNKTVSPALFLAPMAGITHSAFRRLISDFGGYGVLFTEMLSCKALLHEKLQESPYTKKRQCEDKVIYQLALNGHEDMERIIYRLRDITPFGFDLNLGCPAPKIRKQCSGAGLFNNIKQLARVLEMVRKHWDGILTVKCRLGENEEEWFPEFKKRLSLFDSYGIDAITIHPRFIKEKLRKSARWELFSKISDNTDIPVIGNGDIQDVQQIEDNKKHFKTLSGLMLGRISVVKPWIFSIFNNKINLLCETITSPSIDYLKVWDKFYQYTIEDFSPGKALGRIKEFSSYYALNFFYGHQFYRIIQGSKNLTQLYKSALSFLNKEPVLCKNITCRSY